MLREAGLTEMRKHGIPKAQCVFVARKRGNDELAPSAELYEDFDRAKKVLEKELGKGSVEAHNRAFVTCGYEKRFREQIIADPDALQKLEAVSRAGAEGDVYLVCYEGTAKACHRRILLRIAQERFQAEVTVEGVEPGRKGP